MRTTRGLDYESVERLPSYAQLPEDMTHQYPADEAQLQPHIELTPTACGEVLQALRLGIEAFRKCGVALPRGSWLNEATSWLERVSQRGSVGETDDDLRRTSAAVAWAVDLYHISTCLGDGSVTSIARDLAKVSHGRLLASSDASDPKNFLSQFWVGTLLAQSKLNPRIPAYDAPGMPKLDFLIECGRVTFAVEVKRPSNRDAAERNVNVAGGQIRDYDRPGIIVIDATDCMSVDPWEVTRDGATVRARVNQDLNSLHGDLTHFIENYPHSNKFHQVTMLMTFARYWPWVMGDNPRRDAGLNFRATPFFYRWSNQVAELTKVVQDGILRGVEQLTGNPPQYRFF